MPTRQQPQPFDAGPLPAPQIPQETVDSLIRKAGYEGTITQALRSALRVVRYQSSPYTMSYAEYAQGGR